MHLIILLKKRLKYLLNNKSVVLLFVLFSYSLSSVAQCLSSANPVGGTDNILALETNSFRFISFYKSGLGTNYYAGKEKTDYDLISKSNYNYLAFILAYGISSKLSFELETGYFINKTQHYNIKPSFKLKGYGISSFTPFLRYHFITDHSHRIYVSSALGIKIPGRTSPQITDNVELPYQLQSSQGAFGMILNSSFVKEDSGHGLRYFVTNRIAVSHANYHDYKPGTAIFSSVYLSKHLMSPKIKGDWTAILQLRNEIRFEDKFSDKSAESTGSFLLFFVPQLNYVFMEKWNISALVDLPVYQNFNGIQLGAGCGLTIVFSHAFRLQ